MRTLWLFLISIYDCSSRILEKPRTRQVLPNRWVHKQSAMCRGGNVDPITHLKALNSDGLNWVSSISWTSPNSRARFSALAVRMGMRLVGVCGLLGGELDLKRNHY